MHPNNQPSESDQQKEEHQNTIATIMASTGSFVAMVVSFLIVGINMVALAAGVTQEPVSPTEIPDDVYEDLAPFPEKAQQYLMNCAQKMTDKCGEEVFSNIFKNENNAVSKYCCQRLMYMGRKCHDALVKVIMSVPDFGQDKSIAIPRSVMVWNNCAAIASSPAPSPY